jgi:hypothetical protein
MAASGLFLAGVAPKRLNLKLSFRKVDSSRVYQIRGRCSQGRSEPVQAAVRLSRMARVTIGPQTGVKDGSQNRFLSADHEHVARTSHARSRRSSAFS